MEVEVLRKQMDDAKSVKVVAVERASKAVKTTENLHKEIDAEKKSGLALQQQVGLLTKHLEVAKEPGQMVVDLYVAALWQFGGSTSDLPEEPSALSLFAWLKAHLEKLPVFVEGAVDFRALAGATSFVKMLAQKGCPHTEGIQEEKLEGPSKLGTTSRNLRLFWPPFNFVSTS
jgi:hypothetical protein